LPGLLALKTKRKVKKPIKKKFTKKKVIKVINEFKFLLLSSIIINTLLTIYTIYTLSKWLVKVKTSRWSTSYFCSFDREKFASLQQKLDTWAKRCYQRILLKYSTVTKIFILFKKSLNRLQDRVSCMESTTPPFSISFQS
jgi:hypothetical protein